MNVTRLAVVALAAVVVAGVGGVAVVDAAGATDGTASGATAAPNGTVHHQGANLTLRTETNRTIRGSTTLSAGTEVSVTIRGSSSAQPFLIRKVTTVDADGDFAVTVDLSDLDAAHAGPATLQLRADGEVLDTVTVTFEPGPGPEPDDEFTTADGEGDGGTPAFAAHVVQVRDGDAAAITVELPDGGSALLVIGNDQVDYEAKVLLEDGNGDGQVTLLFRTGDSGDRLDAKDAADRIAVPVDAPDAGNGTVGPGNYPMVLYAGNSVESEEVDVGTLAVTGPDGDAADGTGTSDVAGTDDGSSTGEDAPTDGVDPAASSNDSLPVQPSTIGLTAIAVVSLAVAGAITLLRR